MTSGIRNLKKAGSGWSYNEPELSYDSTLDPKTGLPVFYDSLGTTPSITNITKSSLE